MKNTMGFAFCEVIVMLSACTSSKYKKSVSPKRSDGKIYLYGESHGDKKVLDKETELWQNYYNDQNMRHLFVELPYYTAEFLNIWMQSDSNDILDAVYNDWQGTAYYNPDVKEFYR